MENRPTDDKEKLLRDKANLLEANAELARDGQHGLTFVVEQVVLLLAKRAKDKADNFAKNKK